VKLLLWQDEVSQPVFNGIALKCLLTQLLLSFPGMIVTWGADQRSISQCHGPPTASLRILPTNVRSKGQPHENYCLLFMNYFPEMGSLAESKCRLARTFLRECSHLGMPFCSFKVKRSSGFAFVGFLYYLKNLLIVCLPPKHCPCFCTWF